jgi:histidine ammonia-lyase
MDALECLRNETAMILLAAAQAVELRGGPEGCGKGTRELHARIRQVSAFLRADRVMERDVADAAALIASGELTGSAG